MRYVAIIISVILLMLSQFVLAQVRTVVLKSDGILTIRTALGIATIVQLPETIQSAIIGDQSGFKVESLDKAVTIKPLRYNAKTNLYLVTEKRRYNLRLQTMKQEIADYVVYIKSVDSKPAVKWAKFNQDAENEDLKFQVQRIGTSPDGFILVEAKIFSKKDSLKLAPSDFWVTQENKSKVINSLFLSDLKESKGRPLLVGISLSKSDLEAEKPITFEIRGTKVVLLKIVSPTLWR